MIKTLPTFLVLLSLPAWAQNPGPVEGPPACELISFRAEPEDRSMAVRWSTTGDALGDAFIVERSSDRMNWTATITEPARSGMAEVRHYAVVDPAPLNGVAYYRLKIASMGAVTVLSDDFGVEQKAKESLLIEGDRASRRFTVQGDGAISELQVLNNRGQFLVMDLDYQGDRVVVNGDHLDPGTYFVRAMVNGQAVLRQLTVTNTAVLGG
jgi:hypothetical protein